MNTYIVTAIYRMGSNERKDFEIKAGSVFYAICAFENHNMGWSVTNVNLKEISK